jgi:hypothetical protein
MRLRVLLSLLGALIVFLAATFVAERSAHAADFPLKSAAPLCDDRAASAYADEPAPQPVDAGDIVPGQDCRSGRLAASPAASSSSRDELQRRPEAPRETLSLVPSPIGLSPPVETIAAWSAHVENGPRDEHRRADPTPPRTNGPRPIPWRG